MPMTLACMLLVLPHEGSLVLGHVLLGLVLMSHVACLTTSLPVELVTLVLTSSHPSFIILVWLMSSGLVLTCLPSFALDTSLVLGCVVFSVLGEPHSDAFVGISKLIAESAVHGILRCLLVLIIHEGYPLSVLVSGYAYLCEASEVGEDALEFLLLDEGGNVTDIQ